MDLKKCEVLIRAIDLGSLSKAAEESGYTPSGVSHMMSALEDEIGFPLMIRGRNGVYPTENCASVLPVLRELLQLNEQFYQMTSEICGLETGTISIGAYSSISAHWLPGVIKGFQNDYPHIQIRLLEGVWQEVETWLSEYRVDLAFYSYQDNIKHEWIPLKKDPMIAVLPLDHPLAGASAYPLKECEKEDFIMTAMGNDYDVVKLLEKENLSPKIKFSTLENYSALSMIECGLGMSLMNELVTKGRQNNVAMLPLDPPRSITLGIAVPSMESVSPAAKKFISYSIKMLREKEC